MAFPAQSSQDGASFTRRPLTCGRISAARIAFAARASPGGNKSQQESTSHGGEGLGRGNKHQQKSTQFNRVSKSQQKSAIVSKSQHVLVWFVNSSEFFSEQKAGIGT